MSDYHFINYNPAINQEELQRLIRLKLRIVKKPSLFYDDYDRDMELKNKTVISKNVKRMRREAFEQKLKQIQQWFRKKGIVMMEVNDTC